MGLDSLELRRLRQDLIFTYKLLFGLTNDVASEFFIVSNFEHDTRGHSYKLYPRFNRIDLRKYFFTERIIGPWNSLPATEENFESLSKFKLFINSVDLSKHDSVFLINIFVLIVIVSFKAARQRYSCPLLPQLCLFYCFYCCIHIVGTTEINK